PVHGKGASTGVPDQPFYGGTPIPIGTGQESTLPAEFTPGSAESYDADIPGTPTRTSAEAQSVDQFGTDGSFTEDLTSPDQTDTKLRFDERVPPPGTTIDLWIVGHDERGGADFLHRTLIVQ